MLLVEGGDDSVRVPGPIGCVNHVFHGLLVVPVFFGNTVHLKTKSTNFHAMLVIVA